MAHKLTIEYDDDVLLDLGLSEERFSDEARFLLAAKLYELRRMSASQAAHFCGMGRVDFLMNLPRVGVPVSNLQAEDAGAELDFGLRG